MKKLKTNSENYDIVPLCGTPTDYSKAENWMYAQTDAVHEVDLLYFYPTVINPPASGYLVGISDEMRDAAHFAYAETASAFCPYTNVFAPFYRQLGGTKKTIEAMDLSQTDFDPKNLDRVQSYKDLLFYTEVRTDAYAALDYYFEHYNNGRPFIIAGHSQGSGVIIIILEEYMQVHPEFYARMVAAYPIGFSLYQKDLDDNPHVKFAKGATDTGVTITWNTCGAGDGPSFYAGCLAINPLNWKCDETPASASENLGKHVQNRTLHNWSIQPGTADARVDLKRGVVVCTTNSDYETVPGFDPLSLHSYDYAEYYVNIRENGLERCSAFLGHPAK